MANPITITHLTPHLGGGVGTVLMDWMERAKSNPEIRHRIVCLDYCNEWAAGRAREIGVQVVERVGVRFHLAEFVKGSDIIVYHYWDHPFTQLLFGSGYLRSLEFRPLVLWCHNHPGGFLNKAAIPFSHVSLCDYFVATSPHTLHSTSLQDLVQAPRMDEEFRTIWSTRNMDPFFKLTPSRNDSEDLVTAGYVGTVDYKKIHKRFMEMCKGIKDVIPGITFGVFGEQHITSGYPTGTGIAFYGKCDPDTILSRLPNIDIFTYPLKRNHYGTCEQALGEAMAAGIPPVVLNNPTEALIVDDGVSGYVARNFDEFVADTVSLCRNHQLRHHMGRNARERARKIYDINRMVREWEKLFEEIMSKRKEK